MQIVNHKQNKITKNKFRIMNKIKSNKRQLLKIYDMCNLKTLKYVFYHNQQCKYTNYCNSITINHNLFDKRRLLPFL